MKDLPVYLNDHLAGSIGALEMVDHLIETHEGKPLEKFLKAFRDDIEADQRELKQIMEQLGIDESGTRKAGAWVAEKVLRAKLRVGDSGEANLALLQSLESLSLGIAGKRSLWRTLDVVLGSGASLRGLILHVWKNELRLSSDVSRRRDSRSLGKFSPPSLVD